MIAARQFVQSPSGRFVKTGTQLTERQEAPTISTRTQINGASARNSSRKPPPQQCYAPTGRNNGVKANNWKHSGGLKSRSCVTSRSRMRPRSIGLAISTSRHTTKCRQDSD
ncbi:hypothetical protein ABEB36_015722 [Hypothenemus hampei]|uniref:Uncharacterized protein n=1 Tax=Hypothenemus hampei TaxID=57062 RepID=A0ABD1DZS4_HYPHA